MTSHRNLELQIAPKRDFLFQLILLAMTKHSDYAEHLLQTLKSGEAPSSDFG